jgi:hypothetical protein
MGKLMYTRTHPTNVGIQDYQFPLKAHLLNDVFLPTQSISLLTLPPISDS